jgi:hypothetical protein
MNMAEEYLTKIKQMELNIIQKLNDPINNNILL